MSKTWMILRSNSWKTTGLKIQLAQMRAYQHHCMFHFLWPEKRYIFVMFFLLPGKYFFILLLVGCYSVLLIWMLSSSSYYFFKLEICIWCLPYLCICDRLWYYATKHCCNISTLQSVCYSRKKLLYLFMGNFSLAFIACIFQKLVRINHILGVVDVPPDIIDFYIFNETSIPLPVTVVDK